MMDSDSSSSDENELSFQDFKLLAQRKRHLAASSVASSDQFFNKRNKHHSESNKSENPISKLVLNDSQRPFFLQCEGSKVDSIGFHSSKFRTQEQVEIMDPCGKLSPVKYSRRDSKRSKMDDNTVIHDNSRDSKSPKQKNITVIDLCDDEISPITGNFQTKTYANKIAPNMSHLAAFLRQETLQTVTTKNFELAKELRTLNNVNNYQDINGTVSTRQTDCLSGHCTEKEQNQFFDQISGNSQCPFLTNSNLNNRKVLEVNSNFTSKYLKSANHCNFWHPLSLKRTKLPVKMGEVEVVDLCNESIEEPSAAVWHPFSLERAKLPVKIEEVEAIDLCNESMEEPSVVVRHPLSLERTKLPVKIEEVEVIDLCNESMEEPSVVVRHPLSLERTKLPVKIEEVEVIDLCDESMEEPSVVVRHPLSLERTKVPVKIEEVGVIDLCDESMEEPSVVVRHPFSLERTKLPVKIEEVKVIDLCDESIEEPSVVVWHPLSLGRRKLPVKIKEVELIDLCNESMEEPSVVVEREAVRPSLNFKNVTKSFELFIRSCFPESEDQPVAPIFVKSTIKLEDSSSSPKNVKLEKICSCEKNKNDDLTSRLPNPVSDTDSCNKQLEIGKYRKSPFLSSQQDVSSRVLRKTENDQNCIAENKTNNLNFEKEAAIIEQPPIFAFSNLTQEVATQTALEVSTQTDDFYCTASQRNFPPTVIPEENVSSTPSPVICSLPKLDEIMITNQLSAQEVFAATHKNADLDPINDPKVYPMFVEQVTDHPQIDSDVELALGEPIIENVIHPFEEEATEQSQLQKRRRTHRIKQIKVPLENILLNKEGPISIQEVGKIDWLQFALSIHKSLEEKIVGKVKMSNTVKEICCNFVNDTEGNAKRRKSTTKVFRKKNKFPSSRSKKKTTRGSSFSNVSDNSAASDDDDGIVDTRSKCNVSALKKAMLKITRDKLLQSNRVNYACSVTKAEIKRRIEDIFEQLFAAFNSIMFPVFIIRKRSLENCVMEEGRLQIVPFEESLLKKVQYKTSGKKFIVMVYILGKIYNLLSHGLRITKRELYYQICHVIGGGQCVLNKWIEEVTCLLDVPQWDLNIMTRNGLVYGDLKLVFNSNETLNCNLTGTSIPCNVDEIVEIHTNATFILIVEKESIFKQLIEEDLQNKLEMPFILLTGKGFPDLNTQFFLKRLWELLSLPVFIIVDPDPYGIQIMFTYRFGSVANCHLSHHIAVPGVRWLGIFPSEIFKYKMDSTPLQVREKELTARLIRLPCVQNHPQIVNELQTMLSKNQKASIEGLVKDGKFLSDVYLPGKFCSHSYL